MVTTLALSLVIAVITTKMDNPETMHYLLQRLFSFNDGFYPIITMVAYGITSMTIGILWKKHSVPIILMSLFLYSGVSLLPSNSTSAQVIVTAISGPVRLVINYFVCITLIKVPIAQQFTVFFATIGRFSLLSFIFHRVFLQILLFIVELKQPDVSIEILFFFISLLNLAGTWALCVSRLRFPKWNRIFKALYL
jgi:hypothetical protein